MGLFLITASTLMLQIIETRILSVILWYHLAFFAISMAMFGLTAGALWVFTQKDRFTFDNLPYYLAIFSLAYAVATVLSILLQMTLALTFTGSTGFISMIFLAVYLAVPNFFAGLTISLALTRSPYPIGLVYGVDLMGAAVGCFGVLFLLNYMDGPSAILWVAVIAVVASFLFTCAGLDEDFRQKNSVSNFFRHRTLIFSGIIALAIFNSIGNHSIKPIVVKGRVERPMPAFLYEAWNSFSRVTVTGRKEVPVSMWGPSPTMPSWKFEQCYMTIDGDAGTPIYRFRGDLKEMEFLKFDVTNLAYFLPNMKRAAIIGVGGGRDILSARLFGIEEIMGIELNPIFIRLLTRHPNLSTFSGFTELKGVNLINDEARSWFARNNERFDLIQMSLVDTWAATGAGAYSLSENGLYTLEAWHTFLERLTSQGVFTVSRWYLSNELLETGRMLSLAVASLFEMGTEEPKRHIFMASSQNIATLIVSRAPFSTESLKKLENTVARYQYDVIVSPMNGAKSKALRNILNVTNRAQLDRYTDSLDLDITPATDDRPFFFNQLKFSRIFQISRKGHCGGVISGNLIASQALLTIFLISVILVLGTIVLPMRSALKDVGSRLVYGGTIYFFLIGLGFMMVEIALLERLSLFLGHPIYSLSVVLFSLILMTGVGSMFSDKVFLDNSFKFIVWSLTTGGYLALLPLWLPSLLLAWDNVSLLWRGLLCIVIIAPAGFLMGFGFPTGIRLSSAIDIRPTPWFWGINGAAGVLAASIAVFMSIAFGISTALLIGALCYPLLIPAALAIGFNKTRKSL